MLPWIPSRQRIGSVAIQFGRNGVHYGWLNMSLELANFPNQFIEFFD
jgi:hypothetical protein